MKNLDKNIVVAIVTGVSLGLFFMAINLILLTIGDEQSNNTSLSDEVMLEVYQQTNEAEPLLFAILSAFNFDMDAVLANNSKDGFLAAIEEISVRIVAQASVGGEIQTLLEVTSPKETKRLVVTEGTEVNGVLIKSINAKQLVIEKDKQEYTIKLFHPKELNQNRLNNEIK